MNHTVGIYEACQAPIHAYMHFPIPQEGENQTLALDNVAKARQLNNKPFHHDAN